MSTKQWSLSQPRWGLTPLSSVFIGCTTHLEVYHRWSCDSSCIMELISLLNCLSRQLNFKHMKGRDFAWSDFAPRCFLPLNRSLHDILSQVIFFYIVLLVTLCYWRIHLTHFYINVLNVEKKWVFLILSLDTRPLMCCDVKGPAEISQNQKYFLSSLSFCLKWLLVE